MSQEIRGTVLVRPFPSDMDVIETVLKNDYWGFGRTTISTVDNKSGEVAYIAITLPHDQVKRLKKGLKKAGALVCYT